MRPLYKKSFSRDFTLASMDIWWRAEAHNDKMWINERQPFQPYIVFEKVPETVHCFYDHRGIQWIKEKLLSEYKRNPQILQVIEKNMMEGVLGLRSFYQRSYELSHREICEYLEIFEKGYVWFEAAWWLWDMTESELQGVTLPESFRKMRDETQDFGPAGELVIRHSIPKLYPELAQFADVVRVDEIKNNSFPVNKELEARQKGYFFVDGNIYPGVPRQFIEDLHNLKLETKSTAGVSEVAGAIAHPGKVQGMARIVLNVKGLNKVSDGDILISSMTLPDFLPAIRKAGAIVTDEGGMLCHAAIVSRELQIPCVIGTKIATEVFKDGDPVEVDATTGVVKKLR